MSISREAPSAVNAHAGSFVGFPIQVAIALFLSFEEAFLYRFCERLNKCGPFVYGLEHRLTAAADFEPTTMSAAKIG